MNIRKYIQLVVGVLIAAQLLSSTAISLAATNNQAPIVAWSYPTEGSVLDATIGILLTASATDSDGTISYVEFFAGTESLGRGAVNPTNSTFFHITWTNPPAGPALLRVEARDNAGGLGAAIPVQVFVQGVTNGCQISIAPTSRVHGAGSETAMIEVSVPPGCNWGFVNTNPWISTLLHAGPQDGALEYTVAANPFPFVRSGIIRISGLNYFVSQLGATNGTGTNDCTFALAPGARSHPSGVSTGLVSVTTGSNCFWLASTTNSWITVLSPTTNFGSGTVLYGVDANTGPGRTGSIRIDGRTFNVFQGGLTNVPTCTFALSPSNAVHSAGFGTGIVSVTTQSGCVWSAFSTNSWIHFANITNAGSGLVFYVLDENSSPWFRTGVIRIDGKTFFISQEGATPTNECQISISPTGRVHGPGSETALIEVSVPPGCNWGFVNTNTWISTLIHAGPGDGALEYTVAANLFPFPRTGNIRISGLNYLVTQLGGTNGSGTNGCTYTLAPLGRSHPSGVSTGVVSVSTGTNCFWLASTTNSWISVLSPATNFGSGGVQYLVASNAGPGRTGFIRIAGRPFTVAQGGVTNSPSTNALPLVDWVRPTNGSVFAAGSWIPLVAQAIDVDGTVSFVDFYAGSLFLGRGAGNSTNSLYFITWTNAPAGMYQMRAEARDNAGGVGVSPMPLVEVTGVTNLPTCTFALSPSNAIHSAGSETGLVSVTTQSGCLWSPFTTNSWIHFANVTNAGSATVFYFLDENPSSFSRTGVIRIDGKRFFISQAGVIPTNDCQISISPTGRLHGAGSETALIEVSVPPGCFWGYINTNVWISAIPHVGPSDGALQYTVAANPSSASRTGVISISGLPYVVTQLGATNSGTNVPPACSYTLLPLGRSHGAWGSTGTVTVTTASNCFWSAFSSNSWISILSPVTNSGSGTVLYGLSSNDGPRRTGHIRIDGRSFTVNQLGLTNGPATNNLSPVVNWLRPTNGSAFPQGISIPLTANATDADGTIIYVEFFADSLSLGRGVKVTSNSVYNLTWTNPPAGVYRLHAEARDNGGFMGISAPVQVVIGLDDSLVELGMVETTTIGHALFGPSIPGLPGMPAEVVDFLIDQDQSSGGGGVLPAVSVNWDTNRVFRLTVSAPAGHKYVVNVPLGKTVQFGGFLMWESSRGGFSGPGAVTASFTDLEGIAPEFAESTAVLSDSHGYFGFVDLEGTGVTNSFAFKSITLTGTVDPQFTGNGAEDYVPHLDSSLRLSYSMPEAEDPGRFVSIVPMGPLPWIEVVAVTAEAGTDLIVVGRAGRTHVVECSIDTVGWTAIGTGVMPQTCVMPVRDASTTAVGSRFYRVVELP